MHISVISPVYKAENIVDELVRRIVNAVSQITDDFEIILVEDGGPDNSWQKIEQAAQKEKRVVGIKLSRNFGQHSAITAGLDVAKGEWIIVMDCDLQDQPEEISKLYNKALEGFDIVYARRAVRQDTFFKKLNSRIYQRIFEWLSGIKMDPTIANFGIYKNKVIVEANKLREPMRSFGLMVRWVGFKSAAVDVVHASRYEGASSYNWSKLVNHALDVSLAYSDKPLKMTVNLGLTISGFAVLFGIYTLIEYLRGGITQAGYASIILSVWLLSGLIIFSLGVLGLYLGKTFDAVKDRPLYVISEKINN